MKTQLSIPILSFFVLVLMSCSGIAWSETLVLIQGYLGGADNWRDSGITQVLEKSGWKDGGHLSIGPGGVRDQRPDTRGSRRYITLDLPTQAPLMIQSKQLDRYLAYLHRRNPNSVLILVGQDRKSVV